MENVEESRFEGEGLEAEPEPLKLGNCSDICKVLTCRYGRSSAPQHRRLCAAVAAMRSILLDEGLPLIPSAYFAAVISAISDSDRADHNSLAALATVLNILLPLIPIDSLTPSKSRDAAFVLVSLLKDLPATIACGTVRSTITSLGFLMLRVDLDDWDAVELPLELVMGFTVDRRPKVRRCAKLSVENLFKALKKSKSKTKASNCVYCFYKKYITAMENPDLKEHAPKNKIPSKSEDMNVLYMLSMSKSIVPSISGSVNSRIFLDAYKRLDCKNSILTSHILGLLEILLVACKAEKLACESENILAVFYLCLSTIKENQSDIVVSVLNLVKRFLDKLSAVESSAWTRNLPLIFSSVAGLMQSCHASEQVLDVLIDIIKSPGAHVIFTSSSHSGFNKVDITAETNALTLICTMFEKILKKCDTPSVFMLKVISEVFLKLGELSHDFMKNITIELSKLAKKGMADVQISQHLQACIGASIIAMGPEKVLTLIPVSLHVKKSTLKNAWMIPILEKYVVGASLQYFVEDILPLAKLVQNTHNSTARKKSSSGRLKHDGVNLWKLLPSFCRYPTDTSRSFQIMSMRLIVALKEDPSLHEVICVALQELVKGNKSILSQDADTLTSWTIGDFNVKLERLQTHLSKETAKRNIKTIGSSSLDLIRALIDVFFESSPEKRSYLKDAIRSLASITRSEKIQNLFSGLLNKLELGDGSEHSDHQPQEVPEANSEILETNKPEEGRYLVTELVSSFVQAADEDLLNMILNFIKRFFTSEETCKSEAYYVLSKIIEVHEWFLSSRMDEIIDILRNSESPSDSGTLMHRLSCFHHLLVQILRANDKRMDTNAFLVLNEILLTLKSKKESRRLAYDLLLQISSTLNHPQCSTGESDLLRLFLMVMGYLSTSSPHIIGGAISALSLLVYHNRKFCLGVPDLIPSVLVLLQKKDIEIIKAALGFVKVLVSSLLPGDLTKILSDILKAIAPWSAVSKHHFRSKVAIILEIVSRKCGRDAVDLSIPSKYKASMKRVFEMNHEKKKLTGDVDPHQRPISNWRDARRGGKRASGDGVSTPSENQSAISEFASRDSQKRKKQKTDVSSARKIFKAGNKTAGRSQLRHRDRLSKDKNRFKEPSKNSNRRNAGGFTKRYPRKPAN